MKKRDIVKSKILFNNIIKDGNRIQNKYYIIYFVNSEFEWPKFGIAVGKKLGNAVTRNKIKRQLRSIVDNNYDLFSKHNNYIIMSKKELINLDYQNMQKELISLLKGEKDEK